MNFSEPPTKKYKRPKSNTQSTTNPELSRQKKSSDDSLHDSPPPPFPLLAKDSEWVDIQQSPQPESSQATAENEVEEVLQLLHTNLCAACKKNPNGDPPQRWPIVHGERIIDERVECEDGPGMKPLAIMFPDLVDKDPETLQGVLTKVMSTTEVTKHLVDLKQKANFTFMKKSNRLIPREKIWLESLTENTNSIGSLVSPFSSPSSEYEADVDTTEDESRAFKYRVKRRNLIMRTPVNPGVVELTQCIETPDLEEPIAPERNASLRQKQKRDIKPPNLRIGKSIDLQNEGQSRHEGLSIKEVIDAKLLDATSSEDNAPPTRGLPSNEAANNQKQEKDKT